MVAWPRSADHLAEVLLLLLCGLYLVITTLQCVTIMLHNIACQAPLPLPIKKEIDPSGAKVNRRIQKKKDINAPRRVTTFC